METKQSEVQKERLEQQIRFIIEVDKVKNIFRQTYLADGQRKEMMLNIRGILRCPPCF